MFIQAVQELESGNANMAFPRRSVPCFQPSLIPLLRGVLGFKSETADSSFGTIEGTRRALVGIVLSGRNFFDSSLVLRNLIGGGRVRCRDLRCMCCRLLRSRLGR